MNYAHSFLSVCLCWLCNIVLKLPFIFFCQSAEVHGNDISFPSTGQILYWGLRKRKRKLKWSQFVLRETWMCVPNFMEIHPVVVETFRLKVQMWTFWWCKMKSQGIPKVIRLHHLGTMNDCAKFSLFQSEPKWWTDILVQMHLTFTFSSKAACQNDWVDWGRISETRLREKEENNSQSKTNLPDSGILLNLMS